MATLANNELDLIKRLQNSDLHALNSLMDLHKNNLFKLAFRFLGNKEDAEEVLQDTFLRAFQKIESFEGRSSLSTWLYRICV